MESPANHNQIIKLISEAINKHNEAMKRRISGVSLPMRIYRTLKENNLLKEEE